MVRLDHGEPVVRWAFDKTTYRTTWRQIRVVHSDEYTVPPGGLFDWELWVDGNGDCWRRKVIASAWPCEEGQTHLVREDSPLCWHCGTDSSQWSDAEFFVLVSAEGFPADCPARPQTREEIQEFAGELLRVGSPEARARAFTQRASTPTPGGGCPMALAFYGLLALALAVMVIAVVRLVA